MLAAVPVLAGAPLKTVLMLALASFLIDRAPFLLGLPLDLMLTPDFAVPVISRPQYERSWDRDREPDEHDHRVPSQARRVHAVSVPSEETTLPCPSVRECHPRADGESPRLSSPSLELDHRE